MNDLAPSKAQQQSHRDRSEDIHERRTDRGRRHCAQVCPKQPLRRPFKFREFPRLHPEGLHNLITGNGFVKNVLDICQLVLTTTGGAADTVSNLPCRKNYEWDEQ